MKTKTTAISKISLVFVLLLYAQQSMPKSNTTAKDF